MTIEKVPLDGKQEVLPQTFTPFNNDIMLDSLENKHKLKTVHVPEDEEVDERATVEREVTRLLSERRPTARRNRSKKIEKIENNESREEEIRSDQESESSESERSDAQSDAQSVQTDPKRDREQESDSESEVSETAKSEASKISVQKDKKTIYREEREDLLWQLKKLERSKMIVPVVDNCTSLEELRRIIKDIRRESLFDSNINSLKTFLITILHGVEWVGTQQLGLNLTGFAEHEQLYRMDEYDKHLIALSDRSYLGWSEGLPPEFSVLIALVTNTSLYLLQNKKKPMKRNTMQGPSSII